MKRFAIFSTLMFSAGLAQAEVVPGSFFAGFTVGVPMYDKVSASDTGHQLFAGLQLYDALGLEASRVDLGSVSNKGKSMALDGWNVSAVATASINPDITLVGRIGSFVWEADHAGIEGQDDSGNSLSAGAGLYFNIFDNYYLRGDVNYYTADEEQVIAYSGGFLATF